MKHYEWHPGKQVKFLKAQHMDSISLASDEYADFVLGPASERDEEKLTRIIGEKETEENLDKLAKNISQEWKKAGKPDLSFAAFEKKLNEAKKGN
jgi:DNA polymerase III delta prime subunit